MPVRPIAIAPLVRGGTPRANDKIATYLHDLQNYAQELCLVEDGLTVNQARSLKRTLTADQPHVFATVRSGNNLPTECKGPAALLAGYGLSSETIALATGKPTTTE